MPGPHKGYLASSHHQASLSGSLEDGGQGSSPSGPSGRQDRRSSEGRRGVTWPGPQSHASAVLASDSGETRAPSPSIQGPPQPSRSSWKRGCPPGPLSACPVPGEAPSAAVQPRSRPLTTRLCSTRDQKINKAVLWAPGGRPPPPPWKRSLISKQAGA